MDFAKRDSSLIGAPMWISDAMWETKRKKEFSK